MKIIPIILSALLLPAMLFANTAADKQPARPTIGLTFSGGGAKGAAHIGVLKVLEEEGIPVDYVCGTSMGAIIGALYSIGYTADDIENIISSVDWGFLLSDKMDWKDVDASQKELKSTCLASIPFGKRLGNDLLDAISKDKGEKNFLNTLPGGFIGGANILNTFNCLSVGYQEDMKFSDLPIPFCCVAADVSKCEQIVLTEGNLALAMRASMAIPGVFSPVEMDGMLLVDGGLYNNFPVDICKGMGADYIIGVNLRNEKDTTVSNHSSLPKLLARLFDIVTDYGIEEHAKMCNMYVEPDMHGFNTLSFSPDNIKEIVARGYAAAATQRAALKDLRAELDKYGVPYTQTYKGKKAKNMTPMSDLSVAIASINTPELNEREKKWMLRKSNLQGVDSLNGEKLQEVISKWKGTGYFETVNCYLTESDSLAGEYDLTVRIKPQHEQRISLGFRFDTQEAAAILLNFGYNQNSIRGFRVGATAKLSVDPKLEVVASYASLPFPVINLSASFRNAETGLSMYGEKAYGLAYNRFNTQLYLSQFNSKYIDLSAGGRFEYFQYLPMMYRPETEKNAEKTLSLFAHVKIDNRNEPQFPTRGVNFNVDGEWIMKALDSNGNWGSLQAGFETYIPIGEKERFVIMPQLYGRSLVGQSEIYLGSRTNIVGGNMAGRYIDHQLPFIGINTPEYMMNNVAIIRSDFRWNIAGNHYLTAMLNAAQEFDDFASPFSKDLSNTWVGVGLEYAYNTFIGPIKLSFCWSDIVRHSDYVSYLDRLGIYLSFGYDF